MRPRGEDFVEGAVVLPAGTAIGPAQVGVLSTLGMPAVNVHRRPVVAILGSGDELVDLDRFHEVLAGRKIIDDGFESPGFDWPGRKQHLAARRGAVA